MEFVVVWQVGQKRSRIKEFAEIVEALYFHFFVQKYVPMPKGA